MTEEEAAAAVLSGGLPCLIMWRTRTGSVLKSVFNRAKECAALDPNGDRYEFASLSPAAEKRLCRPWVPPEVDGWRAGAMTGWLPMASLPAEWGLKGADGTDIVVTEEDEE